MRALVLPILLLCSGCLIAPPQPAQLSLSNLTFERVHVQTAVTGNPDCGAGDNGVVLSDFMLPLNATRIVTAPPGADVCWRYEMPPEPDKPPAPPKWSAWNRAFVSSGMAVDSEL
ncbi:MAG: hypothetical protein JO038_01590 [Alphaproteobacteria bacterium]|nr:hypothetical protein [Alphaproteobacteria bacterium]